MPRLIVVMPAHNAEQTIESALRSTLLCLPKDSQVVVWNDGSTDGTLERLAKFSDPRIQVIESTVSVGGGVARSEVLRRTDSELVANMDADDVCFPWRFSLQNKHVQKVDISFTAAIKFGATISQLKLTNPIPYGPREVATSLGFHNTLSHPSMFARRAAIEQAGGYRDLKVAQDYDLWLRAATAGVQMGRIGIPCVGYRQSPVQVSRQIGYNQRILAQELIAEAYSSYVRHLASDSNQQLDLVRSDGKADSSQVMELLKSQLPEFRPLLRGYYTRLIRQQRFGPFLAAELLAEPENS